MSRIRANQITNETNNGAPDFPNGITHTGILTTTALAATLALSPIFTGPKICAPDPITTLFPIEGCLFSCLCLSLSILGEMPPSVTA